EVGLAAEQSRTAFRTKAADVVAHHLTFRLVIFRRPLRDLKRVRRRVEDGRVPAAGRFLIIAAVTIESYDRVRGHFVSNCATGEESDEWSTLERVVFTNCAAQHRVFRFDRVENRFHSRRSIKIEMYLIANLRQCSQMMRKNDPNHIGNSTTN